MSLREFLGTTFGMFVAVVVSVLLVVLGIFVWQQFEADILSRQFENNKQSQGYQQSYETQVRSLIVEYNKAELGYLKYKEVDAVTAKTYQAQMKATLNQIYAMTSDLKNPPSDIQQFLAAHPNL